MLKQSLFTPATVRGGAAALSLIAGLAVGSGSPAHAQKLSVLHPVAGTVVTGVRPVAVFEPPDGVEVQSPDELASKLLDPNFTGRILIPRDAQWDMSAHLGLPLRSGVSLIGERGALGSRPLLYTPVAAATAHPEGFTLFPDHGQ